MKNLNHLTQLINSNDYDYRLDLRQGTNDLIYQNDASLYLWTEGCML